MRRVFEIPIIALRLILLMTCNSCTCLYKIMWSIKDSKSKFIQVRLLKQKMRTAKSYEEWLLYADQYDRTRGWNRWKTERKSTLYDYKYIGKLESLLKRYTCQSDHESIISILRANVARNIGGIINPSLYEYSHAGTKELIGSYQRRVLESFQEILYSPSISQSDKIEFFGELRHAYGRTALLLSGGGLLGMTHFGVIKTLVKNKLLPRIISGASAGSLMCALVGTTKKEELYEVYQQS